MSMISSQEQILPINKKLISAIKNTILILGFATLTAVFSQLKLEIGQIPFTMQTLAVLLSGAFLGYEKGALSQIVYLLGGLMGWPWFSRGGGLAYVFSPTFGYIVGFIIAAWVSGFLLAGKDRKNILMVFLFFLLADLAVYIPGLFWLANFVGREVLIIGFYPFIAGDLLKTLLAALIFDFKQRINENDSRSLKIYSTKINHYE